MCQRTPNKHIYVSSKQFLQKVNQKAGIFSDMIYYIYRFVVVPEPDSGIILWTPTELYQRELA